MKRLCIMLALINISASAEESKPVKTALNRILDKDQVSFCRNELINIGNNLIGTKSHRLLNTSTSRNEIIISGILSYKDRPSHITFTVKKNEQGKCSIRYQLSFQLDVPCMDARESAFKKWIHKGQLDTQTHVYQHKRDARKMAHLSGISRGTQCLVTSFFNSSLKK